jgi:hypothetical protein
MRSSAICKPPHPNVAAAAIIIVGRRQRQVANPAKINALGTNNAARSGLEAEVTAAIAEIPSEDATQVVTFWRRPDAAAMNKPDITIS